MINNKKWILYNNVQRKRTWKLANERAEFMAKANLYPCIPPNKKLYPTKQKLVFV